MVIAAVLAAIVLAAWRADRRDRAQLTAELATAHKALAQADARQHDRDAQLAQTLATLAAEKRAITTPAQILLDLPRQIPLPSPITLKAYDAESCSSRPECGPEDLQTASPHNNSSETDSSQVVLPIEDLKPLHDFAIDCQACQAKLAVAQADLTDEQTKTAVLTRERDEAVHIAKGGNLLRRIARNAKWLVIGAAAGAIAAKAHR
jgi:type II secretory pathway pseudopilin PulG